jgi:hypothetical protein
MSTEWYPWYPVLFEADTLHLTPEQDGIYRRLIDWYMTKRRPLPDNDQALAAIARIGVDGWGAHASIIRAFFKVRRGALHQKRCDLVLAQQDEAQRRFLRRLDRRLEMLSGRWARLRQRVFARDNYTCRYCQKRGGRLECDHVKPVARGGKSVMSNLVTACFRCNRAKGARMVSL